MLQKAKQPAPAPKREGESGHDVSPWAVLVRLGRERWREYWARYAIALVLMAIASAATALAAWMMKDVVNDIFVRRDETAMVWIPLAIMAIFLVKGIATYAQEVWLGRIGNQIVAGYQREIYQHLLQMNVGFFQKHTSNDLIMRTTRAAQSARGLINLVVVSFGRDLLTLIALIVVMVSQDPLMSLIVLVAGPIAAIVVKQLGVVAGKVAKIEADTTTKTIGIVRETAQGVRIVKSFQLEDMLTGRMSSAIDTMEQTANKAVTVKAGVNPLIETLGGLSVAGVVAYAGWQAKSGIEMPGHLIAFATALLLAADPARRLSRFHIQLKALAVGVGLMFDIIDTPVAEAKSSKGPPLDVSKGDVQLENVSFSYIKERPILRNVSLTAKGGEMTALVGPSGGGKTTILGLVQGFWTPNEGTIAIDGQSIDAVSLASWRKNIALVSQDVFLFEGTIRDNIMAARPDATKDQLKAAARAAHAEDFISQLPNGYDSDVGELGDRISGGQRQRISIARAFLKDAPILLLDEPTSALDSEAERVVQEALAELMEGRTTIVIAHRLATILRAQAIHVIDQGRVIESGTHQELLENANAYARLYNLQFQSTAEDSESTD